MSKIINVGRVTAYAEAVAGGYTGTLEEWERDLANLGTTAAEVEANRQEVADDKAAVEENLTTVGEYKDAAAQSAAAAAQSAESAHTDALAATAAKEAAQTAQGIAEEARADAVSAKEAAENAQTEANQSASAAAGSALVAGNAAQTATAQAGAASDSATAAAASAAAAAESARTLTIDTTLTQAGQAADAKKTGEGIADLKSAITSANYLYDFSLYDGYIGSDGTISAQTGSKEKYTSQITISDSRKIGIALNHSVARSMWACYVLYNSNGEFIRRTQLAASTMLQSYNRIITITNVEAAFIRFTFRGYDDYNFSVYNTIADDVSTIRGNVNKIMSDIGVHEITFNVTAGTSHSSNNDQLVVKIKANDVFKVDITSTAITGGQIYAFYADGTSEYIYSGNNLHQVFTATKDIIAFGLSVADRFIPNSGTVTMAVVLNGYAQTLNGVNANYCSNVRAVNHRGFVLAPENTVPAYILSRKMGFAYVETDILWTSDDVPVLLHDTIINRTGRNADGTTISDTISIANITYEQALTYDFGIYKGSQYAGTKIPTFAEFIILCKRIGLHPYVELKGGSQTQISGLVDITDRYGMTDNVTWISFYTTFIDRVKTRCPTARLGYITDTVTAEKIAEASALKSADNEVFIDANYANLTTEIVESIASAGLPLEVYTIDSEEMITQLDPYVSGYTSNKLNAAAVLLDHFTA